MGFGPRVQVTFGWSSWGDSWGDNSRVKNRNPRSISCLAYQNECQEEIWLWCKNTIVLKGFCFLVPKCHPNASYLVWFFFFFCFYFLQEQLKGEIWRVQLYWRKALKKPQNDPFWPEKNLWTYLKCDSPFDLNKSHLQHSSEWRWPLVPGRAANSPAHLPRHVFTIWQNVSSSLGSPIYLFPAKPDKAFSLYFKKKNVLPTSGNTKKALSYSIFSLLRTDKVLTLIIGARIQMGGCPVPISAGDSLLKPPTSSGTFGFWRSYHLWEVCWEGSK